MVAAGEGPGVHGGVADAQACGRAVEDDATGVGGGVADQCRQDGFVRFGEDGGGEGVDGGRWFAWGLGEDGGVRAEGFLGERGVERGVVERVKGWGDGVGVRAGDGVRGECADASERGEVPCAVTKGLRDPRSDKRAGLGVCEGGSQGVFKMAGQRTVVGQEEDEAGLGALLPCAGEDALSEG